MTVYACQDVCTFTQGPVGPVVDAVFPLPYVHLAAFLSHLAQNIPKLPPLFLAINMFICYAHVSSLYPREQVKHPSECTFWKVVLK